MIITPLTYDSIRVEERFNRTYINKRPENSRDGDSVEGLEPLTFFGTSTNICEIRPELPFILSKDPSQRASKPDGIIRTLLRRDVFQTSLRYPCPGLGFPRKLFKNLRPFGNQARLYSLIMLVFFTCLYTSRLKSNVIFTREQAGLMSKVPTMLLLEPLSICYILK